MKVLFYYRGIESLGVEYLMSYLKQKGHQVELIFDPGLDDNLFMKFRLLKGANQFDHLIRKAKAFAPDLVALSIPTNLYPFVGRMAQTLKRELGVPVIAGGPHASALPEKLIRSEHIDMVVVGEGEEALAELLEKMAAGKNIYDTRNIWFKKDGEIVRNELRDLIRDLDTLPFPDKKPFHDYGCFSDNLEVVTGRGCPFSCTFCNIHFQRRLNQGKGSFIRRRSVGNVIAELKHHLERFPVKYITFHDDTFTTDPAWIEAFSERYRKEINLPFYCFAYPTTVTPEVVRNLKRANCMQVFMGLDSGDPTIRKELLKRPMSDAQILESARTIRQAGIRLQVSSIFGFPGEGPESMWKTLRLTERAEADLVSGYIFYPFPKTELFDLCVAQGYLGEAEIALVESGEGGYHHGSLLKHPHKKLAVTLSKLIPLYNKAPRSLRPLIRKLMATERAGAAQAIFLLSIPIAFPFLGVEGIKVTLRMAWRAFRMRKKLAWRGVATGSGI